MRKETSGPPVDPASLTAAGEWCIFDEPGICAGVGQDGDAFVFYRKDAIAGVAAKFDTEARRRYPASKSKIAPWSFSDLEAIHAELTADAPYWAEQGGVVGWNHLGIAALGWTRYEPAQGFIAIGGVPLEVLSQVNDLLDARYGPGKVRATTIGGPVSWGTGRADRSGD